MFEDRRLSEREAKRESTRLGRGALWLGLFVMLAGCHAKGKSSGSNAFDGLARRGLAVSSPGKLAAVGKDAITRGCEHESYANASEGLIASESGLHEDVFALRDRDSLAVSAYSLKDALRLEDLLRAAAKASQSSTQAQCIGEFAQHFDTLTDTLLQADKVQRELDLSAFENSTKDAETLDQPEKKQTESEPEEPQ